MGKSHLVCAIGYGLIDRGYWVHFTRTSDLVQRLPVSRREMRLPPRSQSWTELTC